MSVDGPFERRPQPRQPQVAHALRASAFFTPTAWMCFFCSATPPLVAGDADNRRNVDDEDFAALADRLAKVVHHQFFDRFAHVSLDSGTLNTCAATLLDGDIDARRHRAPTADTSARNALWMSPASASG